MNPTAPTPLPSDTPCCGCAGQTSIETSKPRASVYYCPMCPGVLQDAPGTCPHCGMALVHQTGETSQADTLSRQLGWALAGSLPVFTLAMADMVPALHDKLLPWAVWILWGQAIVSTLILLGPGLFLFVQAFKAFRAKTLNMFTLIATGVAAAYGLSWVQLLRWQTHTPPPHVWFESAVMITSLVLLGQVLERRAHKQTQWAMEALLNLAPKTALLVTPQGEVTRVDVSQLQVGDRVRVPVGEEIPADGCVVLGRSMVDEALMTGESVPVTKTMGDLVTGGTLNVTGSLDIDVTAVGAQSQLAQIVALTAQAQQTRAPIQKLADKVAGIFTPVVLGLALVTLLGWGLGAGQWSVGWTQAITVLVVACPCALGLATPVALSVAMGRGALSGILVQEARALETLEKSTLWALDKTGTLTLGAPALAYSVEESADALPIALSLASHSAHPFSKALVASAPHGVPYTLAEVHSEPGMGVVGVLGEQTVALGSAAYMRHLNVTLSPSLQEALQTAQDQGLSVVLCAKGNLALALYVFKDPLRPDMAAQIEALHRSGRRVVLLTGDHPAAARQVAGALDIAEVFYSLSPLDKAAMVRTFQQQGHHVVMVGDGVNDAPALAQAQVGIAVSHGADVAKYTADVVILHPERLFQVLVLSLRTMGVVRQNLGFAFGYNLLGVTLAMGVLPFGLHLTPVVAALAMSLSCVSLMLNARRLNWVSLSPPSTSPLTKGP